MLYRVATVTVFGTPENPRANLTVRLVSDIVVLSRRPIHQERVPIALPTARSPREWLLEALDSIPRQ
ncbi:MAG TPA: hypothetical protein VFD73_27740 [Gemmatimonadales bacterium]|nr:hypothetical protein [Gemmatimonadales bacterium]